jgi:adenylate kinase family enzyme
MIKRINILGAAGTGTTTIGLALAARMGCPQIEADDFLWVPSDPPFQKMRSPGERQALLEAALVPQKEWVLSGSVIGCGDPAIPLLDLVVFLWVPPAIRMARLAARERERYDEAALAPGGALHARHMLFMNWAAAYDRAGLEQRSRKVHELWLATLPCPVLRIEGAPTVEEAVEQIIRHE